MIKSRPCACSWCGSSMWTTKKPGLAPEEKINLRFQGGCNGYLYRSLQLHCAYLLSRALVCCRMGMKAAGLTGALPLLAWMPPVREHLLSYAVGKLPCAKWRSLSLELCSFVLLLLLILLLLAERDLQSLNITLLSPACIEDFLYASYQLTT